MEGSGRRRAVVPIAGPLGRVLGRGSPHGSRILEGAGAALGHGLRGGAGDADALPAAGLRWLLAERIAALSI